MTSLGGLCGEMELGVRWEGRDQSGLSGKNKSHFNWVLNNKQELTKWGKWSYYSMANGSKVRETLTIWGAMISPTLANHSCWSASVGAQAVWLCPFWHGIRQSFARCPPSSHQRLLQGEVVAPPGDPAQSTDWLCWRPLWPSGSPSAVFFSVTTWVPDDGSSRHPGCIFFTSQGTRFHPGSSISPDLSPFCPPAPPYF